jgi:hypothetical protein
MAAILACSVVCVNAVEGMIARNIASQRIC